MRIPTSGPDPTNERIRREAREHVQAEVYASYERAEAELRDWIRVLTATLVSERRENRVLRDHAHAVAQLEATRRHGEEKDALITELRREAAALYEEHRDVHDTLAEALGYPYDDDRGYATGDHTEASLASEAARFLRAQDKLIDRLNRW